MANIPYPLKPEVDFASLTKVSPNYRSNVIKVLFNILLFIFGYLIILCAGALLIYFGGLAAINLILIKAHWVTLLIAVGIMLTTVMFFIFLIKFLFKVKKDIDPNRIEVKKEDQPDLFEFIIKVCNETKAPFPKKVFLSSSVNACVFYNSSFLSMFFPVRKNLEIGLGLVNSLNISEFKAVLAHEFGHFSQSSTKLGSYIYRLNKMIYNLLYDNSGWSDTLHSISSVHGILAFFGNVTVGMVNVVLKIFIKLYELINKSYMSLSREMEFHADLVAVSVTGSENIIKALYRIEFAQIAYNYSINALKDFFEKEKKLPDNFFRIQSRNLIYLSKENGLKLENELPVIDSATYNNIIIPDRIEYKDDWSTHPPIKEREKNAKKNYITAEEINSSTWILFKDKEKLQINATQNIYDNELGIKSKARIEIEVVENYLKEKENQNTFNPVYNSWYDFASMTFTNPEIKDTIFINECKSRSLSDLFSKEITLRVKKHHKTNQEIVTLKNISDGLLKIKKFDFEGKTHLASESKIVQSQLTKEAEDEEKWLNKHKLIISTWFYYKLNDLNSHDAQSYSELMQFRSKMASDREPFVQFYESLLAFYYALQNSEEDVHTAETKLKSFSKIFIVKKGEVDDITVPEICTENNIMQKGYKQTLFESDVRTNTKDLNSLVPFIEDIQKLIEHITAIDDKVFKLVLLLQEKVID